MGNMQQRNIWAYDSIFDFNLAGGAKLYGDGYVRIGNTFYLCKDGMLLSANDGSGAVLNGSWVAVPALFSLIFSGTGAVSVDEKDAAENILIGIHSMLLVGELNLVQNFVADKAVFIRVNFPSSVTVYRV